MMLVALRVAHIPHYHGEAAGKGHGPDVQLLSEVMLQVSDVTRRWLREALRSGDEERVATEFLLEITRYAGMRVSDADIKAEVERLVRLDGEHPGYPEEWFKEWALRAFAARTRRLGFRVYELTVEYRGLYGERLEAYYPLVWLGGGVYVSGVLRACGLDDRMHMVFIVSDIPAPVVLRHVSRALAVFEAAPWVLGADAASLLLHGYAELLYSPASGLVAVNIVAPV